MQSQFLPRGKGLGGSSQINYLLHLDLSKSDLERWKENGATEWSQKEFSFAFDEIDEVLNCYFDDDSDEEDGDSRDFHRSTDTCSPDSNMKKRVINSCYRIFFHLNEFILLHSLVQIRIKFT